MPVYTGVGRTQSVQQSVEYIHVQNRHRTISSWA
jgi:hypothetical protein